jgi:hypothetical protein
MRPVPLFAGFLRRRMPVLNPRRNRRHILGPRRQFLWNTVITNESLNSDQEAAAAIFAGSPLQTGRN